MFDNAMISVDTEYQIRVSDWMGKNNNRVPETKRWEGEFILPPEDERLWPVREVLGYFSG